VRPSLGAKAHLGLFSGESERRWGVLSKKGFLEVLQKTLKKDEKLGIVRIAGGFL